MKPVVLLGIVVVGGLSFGGAALLRAGSDPAPGLFPYRDDVAVARGLGIYHDYCAACHGVELEGQPDWRVPNADGKLPAPPHDATGHTWHHPDAQLFEIVKWGTAAMVGRGYQSDMAGYSDVLTDADILAVMAYIKSTWPQHVIARHNEINARFEASQ